MNEFTRIPAAQYLRMSTENQQYSIANQAAAIAKYAAEHGLIVIRTYTDSGRSGLGIRNRPGLSALLQDVIGGPTEYKAILVYDVSRWGRFQDTDEAAYYEFLCRSNGIPVHYCAEQFTNDLATANLILKSLKRTMAAEYSRELSVRVYAALRRVAEAGLCTGSTPGYGFRRMLYSGEDKPKHLLNDGEEKNLRTDRVKLALGPAEEVKVVRLIYRMLLLDKLRPSDIVRKLSRLGINFHGRPWSFYAVKEILTNPKYCGSRVWGRRETKLKTAPKRTPKEKWIMAATRGPHIVDEGTFARAQKVYFDRTDQKTNKELLDALRRLWQKKGYLTTFMVDRSRLTPAVKTYEKRFGGLKAAFQLIGYSQSRTRIAHQRLAAHRASLRLRRDLIHRLRVMFPERVIHGEYDGYVRCPKLNSDVAVSVCRMTPVGTGPTWSISTRSGQTHGPTLLCLLNNSNSRIKSYYVFPRLVLKHAFRIREDSEVLLHGKKLRSLREFYRAVVDTQLQLPDNQKGWQPEILCGIPQMARYLNESPGIFRRLLKEGLPVARRGRRLIGQAKELKEWIRQHGTAYEHPRDRLGRYL